MGPDRSGEFGEGVLFGPSAERVDLVSLFGESVDHVPAHVSGGPGDEYSHGHPFRSRIILTLREYP